jgi:hypothetical protein
MLTFSKFGLLLEGTRTPMPYQDRGHFPIFNVDLPTNGAIEGIPPDLTFGTDPDSGLRVVSRDQSKFPRRVGFYIESMLPSAWNTGNFTTLRVYPIRVPRPINTTLRLIPPDGYLFGIVDGNPPESTAPLGTALDSGSGLTYPAGPFFPNEIYAINAEVFIPMEDLTKGSPGWYLEFGYEAPNEINLTAAPPECERRPKKVVLTHGEDFFNGSWEANMTVTPLAERRVFAVHADTLRIRTITAGEVAFSTNIEFKLAILDIQVEFVTPASYLIVETPHGFEFEPSPQGNICEQWAAYPDYRPAIPLPRDVDCVLESKNGTLSIVISAATALVGGTMPGGHYGFRVFARLPAARPLKEQVVNITNTTPVNQTVHWKGCVFETCWTFSTLGPDGEFADVSLSIPGFHVASPLLHAGFAPFEDSLLLREGRDDGPTRNNRVLLAFSVRGPKGQTMGDTVLEIKLPEGVFVPVECGTYLTKSRDTVLRPEQDMSIDAFVAESYDWPHGYHPFPPQVEVQSCLKDGDTLKYSLTAGLKYRTTYVVALQVQNPMYTPSFNHWSIAVGGGAYDFPGFMLWSFTAMSLSPMVTAKTRADPEACTENVVTLRFRPSRDIGLGGMLIVEAPRAVILQEWSMDGFCKPPEIYGPMGMWNALDFDCRVHKAPTRYDNPEMHLKLVVAPLIAGEDYLIYMPVCNGRGGDRLPARPWKLRSISTLGELQDTGIFSGYEGSQPLSDFSVELRGAVSGNATVSVMIQVAFDDVVQRGDRLVIEAPLGFEVTEFNFPTPAADALEAARLIHRNQSNMSFDNLTNMTFIHFNWSVLNSEVRAEKRAPKPCKADWGSEETQRLFAQSGAFCVNNRMEIFYNETEQLPERTNVMIEFKMLRNPTHSPHSAVNWWRALHHDAYGVKSSGAAQSWEIVSQMSNVTISLLGPLLAVKKTSTLAFSFVASSFADRLLVQALSNAFDLTRVKLVRETEWRQGMEDLVGTTEDTVEISMNLKPHLFKRFVVANVVLGSVPGPTTFRLTTYSDITRYVLEEQNLPDGGTFVGPVVSRRMMRDDRIETENSFLLPGQLQVLSQKLEEHPAPDEPGIWWGRWGGFVARATFRLRLAVPIVPGDMLFLFPFAVTTKPEYNPDLPMSQQMYNVMDKASLSIYDGPSIQTAARVHTNVFDESFLELTVFEYIEGGWQAGYQTLLLNAQMKTPEIPVPVLPAEAVPCHGFRLDIYRPGKAMTDEELALGEATERTAEEEGEGEGEDGEGEGEGEDGEPKRSLSVRSDEASFETFSQFRRQQHLSLLPTQTEDGQQSGFPLSQRAYFKVHATRTPPLASVQVFIDIALPQLQSANFIILYPPKSMKFASNCGSPHTRIAACELLDERTARFTINRLDELSPLGQLLGLNTSVYITAGRYPPENNVWRMQAKIDLATRKKLMWIEELDSDIDDDDEVLVSWDSQAGFPLQQLEARIFLAKLPGLITPLIVSFLTFDPMSTSGELRLTFEEYITVRCDFDFIGRGGWERAMLFAQYNDFKDYSPDGLTLIVDGTLPPIRTCAVDDLARTLRLTFMRTLEPGEHTIAILSETDARWQPVISKTSLVLADNGTAIGAVYDFPGPDVVFGLKMNGVSINWFADVKGAGSQAALTISVRDSLLDNTATFEHPALNATDGSDVYREITRLVMELPDGFTHYVSQRKDVIVYPEMAADADLDGDSNPVGATDRSWWLDLPSGSANPLANPGDVTFRFASTAPAQLPTFNVWRVTLCEGPCVPGSTHHVAVTFPVPGAAEGTYVDPEPRAEGSHAFVSSLAALLVFSIT